MVRYPFVPRRRCRAAAIPEPDPMAEQRPIRPFRLVRHFGMASLIAVFAIAALVAFSYREISIATITEMGEHMNLHLAQAALNSLRPELSQFLSGVADAPPEALGDSHAPEILVTNLRRLVDNTAIVRVKLYNRLGVVVYSTKADQIGNRQHDNPAVIKSLVGEPASKLVYRDTFNYFDRETADDNLIQSYLPVRGGKSGVIIGVFEIYTDVNDLVKHSQYTQQLLFLLVLVLFVVLFAVQFAIVWRAGGILDRQEVIIRDRARTLELLSAQLLTAQEDEKKRIAHVLHEDIAQTLAALKLRLEVTASTARKTNRRAEDKEMAILLHALQDAIRDTRSLAVRLRPTTLDDFGLIPTLDALRDELREMFPQLHIETRFVTADNDIPRPLQTILYRIIQDVLDSLARQSDDDQWLVVGLQRTNSGIELSICEPDVDIGPASDNEPLAPPFTLMKERALLSGGDFRRQTTKDCPRANVAYWPS